MDEILQNLLVILVTGVLIAGLFGFLAYRKRQKQARLEQAARERGWHLVRIQQPLISGFILSGKLPQGVWTLESKAEANPNSGQSHSGSSNVSHNTRWWSEAVQLPERAVVIGPRPKGASLSYMQPLNSPLIRMGLRLMLGEDADWVSGLSLVENNSALAQHYLCLANDEGDIERLVSREVEKVLLQMPEKRRPVIKLRANGLEIGLLGVQLTEVKDLEAMINAGKVLVRAWQEGEGRAR